MVLKKLKPGITVYEVREAKGLSRHNGKWQWWPVRIIEIDAVNKMVLASWNGNKNQWYIERSWSKWRLNPPNEDHYGVKKEVDKNADKVTG